MHSSQSVSKATEHRLLGKNPPKVFLCENSHFLTNLNNHYAASSQHFRDLDVGAPQYQNLTSRCSLSKLHLLEVGKIFDGDSSDKI